MYIYVCVYIYIYIYTYIVKTMYVYTGPPPSKVRLRCQGVKDGGVGIGSAPYPLIPQPLRSALCARIPQPPPARLFHSCGQRPVLGIQPRVKSLWSSYKGLYPQTPVILHGVVSPDRCVSKGPMEPLNRLRGTLPKSIIGLLPGKHAKSLVPSLEIRARIVISFPVVFGVVDVPLVQICQQ